MVLWHTEVEQQKPADIAPLLGMSANSVSALAYRAREGLRQAFLSQHAADPDDVDCGLPSQAEGQADSTATSVPALVAEFNALFDELALPTSSHPLPNAERPLVASQERCKSA